MNISISITNFIIIHNFILYKHQLLAPVVECDEGQGQCADGECIPEGHFCDGIRSDCDDGSDEANCPGWVLINLLVNFTLKPRNKIMK